MTGAAMKDERMGDVSAWLFDNAQYAAAAGVSLLARLVRRISFGQPLLSWAVLLDIPVAAFMAILGAGAADYLGLDGNQKYAAIGVIAWLGPTIVDKAIERKWRNTDVKADSPS
jgi:hypothetical protein